MYVSDAQRQSGHQGDDRRQGVPATAADIVKALHQAGIEADPAMFDDIDQLPGFFMARYQNRPEFEEGFFRVKGDSLGHSDQGCSLTQMSNVFRNRHY